MTLLTPDLHLTGSRIPVMQRAVRTHAGMAHFAGSGPDGATCRQCSFMLAFGDPNEGRCRKFQELMAGRMGRPFPQNTASCEHFATRRGAR